MAVTMWARFFGARRVVVSERVEHRRDLALRLGATDTIAAGPDTDTAGRFAEITGAEPDVVIEAVGRPGMLTPRWPPSGPTEGSSPVGSAWSRTPSTTFSPTARSR